MVKRFIERFELWREEQRDEREDKEGAWLLFLAALLIGQSAYSLITSGRIEWRAIISTALVLVFVLLYLRRSRWTWAVVLAGAAALLIEAPVIYLIAPGYTPPGVRLLRACVPAILGAVGLVYSLRLRRRFSRDDTTTI